MCYERGKCFDETHHPARVSAVRNNSMVTKVIGLQEMGESNKLQVVRNNEEIWKDQERSSCLTCGRGQRSDVSSRRYITLFARSISPVELLVARAGKLDEPGRMCREVASIVACLFACIIACFLALFTFEGTFIRSNEGTYLLDRILLLRRYERRYERRYGLAS